VSNPAQKEGRGVHITESAGVDVNPSPTTIADLKKKGTTRDCTWHAGGTDDALGAHLTDKVIK
jgi:hypothetical protein